MIEFIPYILLAALIFGINLFPAFMPPTWTILAFFAIRYHLNLFALVIIGATMATCGRIGLYTLSKRQIQPRLSKKTKDNYQALGNLLDNHKRLTIPALFGYAFLPIPSNQVFIAAGLANFSLRILASCFFVGRLISYSFWVSLSHHVSDNLETSLVHHYSHWKTLVMEILSLFILVIISKIPWQKWFGDQNPKRS